MLKLIFFCSLLLASAKSEGADNGDDAELSKHEDASPTSVDSRFFDLGGIFNQLLPGFNQGNHGGPARNPAGMDFPTNSQFYPTGPIQGQTPQMPIGSGNNWPVLDDAKQYPNQGQLGQGLPLQPQYPNQGNFGGFPQNQYPSQGNFMGTPTMPNLSYPNQIGGGGVPPNQIQEFPNQVINGVPMQNQNMYPGNFGGGYPNQYPQNPNQGGFGGMQNPQFGNQGNFGVPMNQYPQYPNNFGTTISNPQYPNQIVGGPANQFQQFPNFNGGGSMQTPYPNQGGFMNQNPNNFGPGDGTLDTIASPPNSWGNGAPSNFSPVQFNSSESNVPPEDTPTDNDDVSLGSDTNGGGGIPSNAILGKPVIVPSTTTEPGQIVYPTSTESAARKQCVQDCQTTTEYNPVCGSDNVTYINPGKFVCARNCGINVFVARRGRCPKDTPFPRNVLAVNKDVSTSK